MGLPMWREPDDEVNAENIAKVERIAAVRRSTIRREPSVRPGRDNVSIQSVAERLHGRSRVRTMRVMRERLEQEDRDHEQEIAQLQEELAVLRRMRNRNRTQAAETQVIRAGRDFAQSSSAQTDIRDETDRNANGEGALEPADTVRQHLPRPARESNLRFEVPVSRSSSPWRYQVLSRTSIPSPPHSSGSEYRDRSIPDGPLPFDEGPMPALTEGFAPAQQQPLRDTNSSNQPTRVGDDPQGLETPPPETWEASYPPLRRVNHMSPRPVPRVDGLGDRRRSPSPSSDTLEEETWATLLTDMETGRSSSTTSTSFASTQADTQPRSGRSSQNTTTSFGEIGSGDDACDLDLPPGITEEDVLEMRARHRPMREHSGTMMTGRRGLQEHQDRISARREVRMFRDILQRMHNREEIPDEWWTTPGLSPDLDRP